MWNVMIVGCGLSGIIAARELADQGNKVLIFEKRRHIGGNIFDEKNADGFLIQKYGPHCFFTNDRRIRSYIEKFVRTEDQFVTCKTVINGRKVPMPFNFESAELIYGKKQAAELKNELLEYFTGRDIVSVTELLHADNKQIADYGRYMYENEYKQYSAKQWGRSIDRISPEVFKRVPVYLSYKKDYQPHTDQFLPVGGFTKMAEAMLNHKNIKLCLGCDVVKERILNIEDGKVVIRYENTIFKGPVLFTGELDSLFQYRYGHLPYRSLEFIWKSLNQEEFQDTEIVAYPQADKITRITEYKKLPHQNVPGRTVISIEIPFEYNAEAPVGNEPYYPVKNETDNELYAQYRHLAASVDNLFLCGRLADYQYYNMDMVMINAWKTAKDIMGYREEDR